MSVAVRGARQSDFASSVAGQLGRLARTLRRVRLVQICLAVWAGPALAQTSVSLQLVLAVDASGSVSQERFELQKQGYAAAFRSSRVLQAIRASAMRSIAVAMVQWTGPTLHVVAVDWMLVDSEVASKAFAAAVEAAPRQLFGGGTSISGAIDVAREMLADKRFRGERQIIDISGDGANNGGRSVRAARDEAIDAGIGINGLPILTLDPYLDRYYRENVIGGPGAFVIAVERYEDFADAILNKLVTEIAGGVSPRRDTAVTLR